MSIFKTLSVAAILSVSAITAAAIPTTQAYASEHSAPHKFIKKSKSIKGSYDIVQRGDKTFVVFSEDFKAKRGPDLKVFLSPTNVRSATSRNAVIGSVKLGKLQTNRGVQEYEIPAGIDVADYESVLVHCEAYSVLWGGADI
ncbi:MAG: DM13 domain-containing protein [Pseudomonadota bacterium]